MTILVLIPMSFELVTVADQAGQWCNFIDFNNVM